MVNRPFLYWCETPGLVLLFFGPHRVGSVTETRGRPGYPWGAEAGAGVVTLFRDKMAAQHVMLSGALLYFEDPTKH